MCVRECLLCEVFREEDQNINMKLPQEIRSGVNYVLLVLYMHECEVGVPCPCITSLSILLCVHVHDLNSGNHRDDSRILNS